MVRALHSTGQPAYVEARAQAFTSLDAHLPAVNAERDAQPSPPTPVPTALRTLVETVEATGGVRLDRDGYRPFVAPAWIDLAEAQVDASHSPGKEPQTRRRGGGRTWTST